MLKYQNATGTTDSLFLSDASHWTTKRAVKSACPRSPTKAHRSSRKCPRSMPSPFCFAVSARKPAAAVADPVSQRPGRHPADRQHVREPRDRPVRDPVLRASVAARAMPHRNLDHLEPLDADERGKE